MQIMERNENGVEVFVLHGRADTQGAINLDIVLHGAVSKGKTRLVLDMSGVDYIASAGLGILADVLTRSKEHGGDLKLVGLDEKILRIFQIIGFDRYFSVYETLPEALDAFA